jgi:hypothetical protein
MNIMSTTRKTDGEIGEANADRAQALRKASNKRSAAKAEERFQDIIDAARHLYEAVTATREGEAKHVLRRLERMVYEVNECHAAVEFAGWCLNELDVLDAARLRLTADHDLPLHEHMEICHRFAVAEAAAENGVTIDPTFADDD